MTINSLPDELLVEIFDWSRLDDGYDWIFRRRWYKLLQICRRWRYVVLEWASRLKICFLCNSANPITTMPSHLTAIPLAIKFEPNWPLPYLPKPPKKELLLALQHCNRLYNIFIGCCALEGSGLLKALDNAFPILEALSLLYNDGIQVLPNNFVAPRLRALHLVKFTIPMGHLSLTNAANLLSLRLERIPASGYYPPEYLVECIANMPHLENIWFGFEEDPDMVMELARTEITRMVLPKLSRLKYTGIIIYLDNLLARISTPVLHDFRFLVFLTQSSTLTVLSLPTFLGTIQNLDFRTAVISFDQPSFKFTNTYHPEQPSVVPPYFSFNIYDEIQDRAAVSMIQTLCSANAPALPVVEYLDLEAYWYSLGFMTHHPLWYTFLRLFRGVKTLRTDSVLATVLSDVLDPHNEAATNELLPVLSELVVVSRDDLLQQPFSSFIHARRLAGHSVDLRVIQHRPSRFRPPPISGSFDTFAKAFA
jgi:hypothetical protein